MEGAVFTDDTLENFSVLDAGFHFSSVPYHSWVAENFVNLALVIARNSFVIGEIFADHAQSGIDCCGSKSRIENNVNQNPVVIGVREKLAFKVFELIKVGADFIGGEILRTSSDECGLDFLEDGLVIFQMSHLIAFGLREAAQLWIKRTEFWA